MPLPLDAVAASFATSTYNSKDDPSDDWEAAYAQDDNDKTDPRNVSDNARLWTEANKPKQTYTIVSNAASSPYSSQPRVPPVQALSNGPALTILKRPTSAASLTSNSSTPSSKQPQKSLSQREKDYEEAKRRIFGETAAPSSPAAANAAAAAGNGCLASKVEQMSLEPPVTTSRNGSRSPAGFLSRSGRNSPREPKTEAKPQKVPAGVTRAPKGAGEGKGFGGRK
ncbi:hypothetical protein ACM66B_005315 [Microbotryomycetes sp. NB124-2]